MARSGAYVRMNVRHCVDYLRSIGVELSDETVNSWDTTERVHRYLRQIRKPVRVGKRFGCSAGHSWDGVLKQNARSKADKQANKDAGTCPECGNSAWRITLMWTEAHDGTVIDYRPKSERWRPMEGL